MSCWKVTEQEAWFDTASADNGSADTSTPGTGSDPTGNGESDPLANIDPVTLPAGTAPCREPVLGRVQDITDGDTFKVQTGRGVERVRMIGINTPEVDHTGPDDECFAEEASVFLDEKIGDRLVWLTFDTECDDRYDRTLAYVHTLEGFIQRTVLQAGMGYAYVVSPNNSFSSMFSSDEASARSSNEGLWGECG